MRNLKRALSLAMASVMLLGMMVVGTSAAGYSDVSAEQNQEAIEVLQAAGIMTGDQNGNFNPAANVTRNEMAVVMSNLMDYTVSTYKGTAPFTDVPEWAEPYVAACYTNGIIAGYSDTIFGGNDPVTTGQAALMLLKALGYFQEPGDFGEDWLVATTKQGALAELFDGVDTGAVDALTRNDVAQLVLNALQADCVQIGSHDLVSDGKGGFTTKAVYDSRTSSDNKYGKIFNEYAVDGRYTIQLGEELYNGNLERRDDVDAFGRPAVEWKYNAQKVGLYADDSNLVATYTAKAPKGEMYSYIGSSVYNNLVDGRYDLVVYVDGARVTAPAIGNYFDKNSTGAAGVRDNVKGTGVSGNGVVTELYLDSIAREVRVVMVNTWLVKATADYNSTKESLNIEVIDDINTETANDKFIVVPAMGTSIDNDDVYVADFKEDDYILVTYSYMNDAIESAQLAKVMTGEVSEYTVTENVVMDGTTYKYNKLVGSNQSGVIYTIGEDAKVVMDAYGYIIYVDEAVSTNSYVYVAEQTSTAGSRTVKFNAYFTDGIYEEITVKKVNGETATTALQAASGWYTFSKDDSNRYSLNSVNNPQTTSDVGSYKGSATTGNNDSGVVTVTTNGIVAFSADLTNIKGDSSTIFVVLEADGDVTAYTGVANVPDITIPQKNVSDPTIAGSQTADLSAVYNRNTGYADYVFIDLSNAADAKVDDANSVADYLFILKTTGNKTYVADDEYWQYEVVMDNQKTTKYIAESIGAKAGDLMRNVKENAKGFITDADPYDDAAKRDVITMTSLNGSIDFSGDTLSITGDSNDAYVIKDGCKATLMIGKGVSQLLKDADANYELYQTTVRAAAGILKNYDLSGTVYVAVDTDNGHVATDVYIYIKDASERVVVTPAVSNVKVNGTTVTAYSTIANAVSNATNVTVGTSVTVTATGANSLTYSVDQDYSSTFSEDSSSSTYTATSTAGNVDVVKITDTNANGETAVVYVATKGVKNITWTGTPTFTGGEQKITVSALTLTQGAGCDLADLDGTLSVTLFKTNTVTGLPNVEVTTKNITVTDGVVSASGDDVFTGLAAGDYKVTWVLTITGAAESTSGSSDLLTVTAP